VLSSNQRNWTVFFGAAAITAMSAALFLIKAGINDDNIRLTSRLSAPAAFVLSFLPGNHVISSIKN